MYNYFTKESTENQILIDKGNDGREKPWRENKEKSLLLAESYKRLGFEKKYYRVLECSTYLEFKRYVENNILKLNKANFCRDRLCPMCGWRRSRKIFGQTSKIMDKALDEKEYRFIFLTLTCQNVEGDKLKDTLDRFFKSFDKMFRRAAIKKSVKGWFRGLEVTHNLDKKSDNYGTYHPHFHIVLMVNKSYFSKPELYLSQENWTNLWKESLQIDYIPIVDVRVFKTGSKKAVAKSVAESAKYVVKDNDYILPYDEEITDKSVEVLSMALANRRLVAFGGKLKEIHRELNLDDLEKGDLISVSDEEEEVKREDLKFIIEHYNWNIGYKQYYKTKIK